MAYNQYEDVVLTTQDKLKLCKGCKYCQYIAVYKYELSNNWHCLSPHNLRYCMISEITRCLAWNGFKLALLDKYNETT